MAYCTKCGFQAPAGSAFCNRCGARIEAAPEAPAPKSPKKRTRLIVALVAAALVVGVGLGLVFSGAFGHRSSADEEKPVPQTPAGTWTLVSCSGNGRKYTPGDITLMLGEGGHGHGTSISRSGEVSEDESSPAYSKAYTEDYEDYPVAWTDSVIMIPCVSYSYTLNGDTLTLSANGDTLLFHRTGEAQKNAPLPSGVYTLTRAEWGGQDETDSYRSTVLQVFEGKLASLDYGKYRVPLTWTEYFFIEYEIESDEAYLYVYTFDGSILTLTRRGQTLTFAFQGG